MNKWLQLLIGMAVALVLIWVFSSVASLLFWGILALVLVAAVAFVFRKWKRKRKPVEDPERLLESKPEDDIERLIQEMERMTGRS